MSGDYLLTEASNEDVNCNTNQGTAYFYQRSDVGSLFAGLPTILQPTHRMGLAWGFPMALLLALMAFKATKAKWLSGQGIRFERWSCFNSTLRRVLPTRHLVQLLPVNRQKFAQRQFKLIDFCQRSIDNSKYLSR